MLQRLLDAYHNRSPRASQNTLQSSVELSVISATDNSAEIGDSRWLDQKHNATHCHRVPLVFPYVFPARLSTHMGASDSQKILMPMSFSENEWRMLRSIRPNILVIGGADFVASTVSALVAVLAGPVSYLPPNAPPPVDDGDAKMIVVPDVAGLSRDRQREWVTWLSDVDVRHPQIVATSDVPLYPLVKSDQFSGVLYYRLNTILLDMQTAEERPARKSHER